MRNLMRIHPHAGAPGRLILAVAICLIPAALRAQFAGSEVSLGVGRTEGLLGYGLGRGEQNPFVALEFFTNPVRTSHWSVGLAYGAVSLSDECCGPTPTLTYRYHVLAPSVGAGFDFLIAERLRARYGWSLGPSFLRQSRDGTPPPGVSPREPHWDINWVLLGMGLSAHYGGGTGLGASAGFRFFYHVKLSRFAGNVQSDAQAAPHVALSWSW